MKFKTLYTVIDAHTEGNPERVVISSMPAIPGETMLEKGIYMRKHMDHIRKVLTHEPRGHSNMCASLVVPPANPKADFGILYLEPGGYATMCGHGTISICTVLVEMGLVEAKEPVTEITLDTPAGLIHTKVTVKEGSVESVTIKNVPSFLYKSDVTVDVPGIGKVTADISYGGNFYAILPAEQVGLRVHTDDFRKLIDYGSRIWEAVNEQVEIQHPIFTKINCLNYVQFYGSPMHEKAHVKNAVVCPPSAMDRSPCGTGTSAKMAALYARGELELNQEFIHESIIGTLYFGELVEKVKVGDFDAVIPTIRGSAYIWGINQLVIDPRDPFPHGFQIEKQGKIYGFDF